MRALIVLVALLVASSASAQDQIFRASLASAVVAHAMDLATTEHCLGAKTCTETNAALSRFTTQPIAYAGVKMGVAALSLWGTAKLHETHPKLATAINLGVTALFTGVAVHNTRVIRE